MRFHSSKFWQFVSDGMRSTLLVSMYVYVNMVRCCPCIGTELISVKHNCELFKSKLSSYFVCLLAFLLPISNDDYSILFFTVKMPIVIALIYTFWTKNKQPNNFPNSLPSVVYLEWHFRRLSCRCQNVNFAALFVLAHKKKTATHSLCAACVRCLSNKIQ